MRFSKTLCYGLAGGSALLMAAATPAQYNTVGTYDATPTSGMSIVNATSNAAANGILGGAFATMISSAFAANSGGDIDFEPANNWTGSTIPMSTPVTIHYGVSQSNTLTMSRTDSTFGATGWYNSSTSPFWSSSSNDLQFAGAPDATFTFGTGLLDVGITMLPVNNANLQCTLVATLSNLSTITTSTETTNGNVHTAVFFGISAPSGTTITSLKFIDAGALGPVNRYDDFGFIVAPAPEPLSWALIGFGGLALMRRGRGKK